MNPAISQLEAFITRLDRQRAQSELLLMDQTRPTQEQAQLEQTYDLLFELRQIAATSLTIVQRLEGAGTTEGTREWQWLRSLGGGGGGPSREDRPHGGCRPLSCRFSPSAPPTSGEMASRYSSITKKAWCTACGCMPSLTTRAWNSASTRALSCSDDLCLQSVKLAPASRLYRAASFRSPSLRKGRTFTRARRVISSPQQPPLTIGGRPEDMSVPCLHAALPF